VQVLVAINNWRRPFFDNVQAALSGEGTVTAAQLYGLILIFAQIAFVWVGVYVATRFFVSHWVFRWRQAMNDYYMSRWTEVRRIEGTSQRVQEDTMRFASIMEDLGVSVVDSVMTLFAFLPVLAALSVHVTELPLVGAIASPLLYAALFWSAFGTLLLAVAGIRLPGPNFRNQRVEAAYRKELVYVILIPTIAAGQITFGLLQQILTAFGRVSDSFQYLVNSWSTIIELLSIHKRLAAFEAAFEGRALAPIEQEHPLAP